MHCSCLTPYLSLCPLITREEDEFLDLRSELSHSQQEANEDGRSVDQDGASVSLPGNHFTFVTADMGQC